MSVVKVAEVRGMRIDSFKFGAIEIDGKRYGKDVAIDASGGIDKRREGFLKFGSHNITREEIEDLSHRGEKPDLLIVGLGTSCAAKLDPAAEKWAGEAGVELVAASSPEAVERFNREQEKGQRKVAALIHITC